MIVALFEDECFENFLPLTYTRAAFELRCGMYSPLQRVERGFGDIELLLFAREYLSPTLRRRTPYKVNEVDAVDDEILLINGSLHLDQQTQRMIRRKLDKDTVLLQKGRIALAHLGYATVKRLGPFFLNPLTSAESRRLQKECRALKSENLPLISYPWDLVKTNAELITKDYSSSRKGEGLGAIDSKAVLLGEKTDVYVGEEAFVEAFTTLDARNGPIYIGRGTTVQSGSRISGPTYIGNDTLVASAFIREGCSVGNVCRIGGELEATIVQGFTNKHHLGYIGHSYIGEWINIGAGTTNSDLKNTYGSVKIKVKESRIETHLKKVGCFIGDHAKTSIGTQIYTGIKIGVASHVHGVVTENVPSFTIWAKSLNVQLSELYLESAIETQKRVMARRGVRQTKEDVELLKKLFDLTAQERRRAKVTIRSFKLSPDTG